MKRWAVVIVLLGLFFVSGCIIDPNPPTPPPPPGPTLGAILFLDDFDDGVGPGWDLSGNWFTSGGDLLHGKGASRAWGYIRGGRNWSDYVVEATVDPRKGDCGLMARCSQDLQTYVLAYGDHDSIRLSIFVDGDYFDGTELFEPGLYEGEQQMRVEVEGDQARVYLNGNLRISFSGVPLLTGMPGLYSESSSNELSHRPRFDDVSVIELN